MSNINYTIDTRKCKYITFIERQEIVESSLKDKKYNIGEIEMKKVLKEKLRF